MPVNKDLLNKTKNDLPSAVNLIITWAFGRRAHIGGTPTPGLWMLGGGRQLLMKNDKGQLYSDFSACNQYINGVSAANNVHCPTLLVAGSDDRMTPMRTVRDVGALITGSKTVIICDAGHMMMIEQPDETLKSLLQFASSTLPIN